MMDDKDGRGDIPDKLRFDIRAYAWGPLIRSLTVCLRHFASRGRGQMASVRVHEYNKTVSRNARSRRAPIRVRSRAAAAAAATIL